jgi:uncharacterized membrane protein
MSFSRVAALYGVCIVAFFALDFVWLSQATPRIYKPALGSLLSEQPKLGVAAVFYLLYVVGVVVFAVVPALQQGNVVEALWRGALFGFLAYATYDLTNLATLRDFPWRIAAIDMVWGTVLNTAVAAVGYYAGVYFVK